MNTEAVKYEVSSAYSLAVWADRAYNFVVGLAIGVAVVGVTFALLASEAFYATGEDRALACARALGMSVLVLVAMLPVRLLARYVKAWAAVKLHDLESAIPMSDAELVKQASARLRTKE